MMVLHDRMSCGKSIFIDGELQFSGFLLCGIFHANGRGYLWKPQKFQACYSRFNPLVMGGTTVEISLNCII